MDWTELIIATASSMPQFVPVLLRQLADQLEQDPTLLPKILAAAKEGQSVPVYAPRTSAPR